MFSYAEIHCFKASKSKNSTESGPMHLVAPDQDVLSGQLLTSMMVMFRSSESWDHSPLTLPVLQILFGKLQLHLLRPQDALPTTGLRRLPSTSEAVVRFESVPLLSERAACPHGIKSLSGPRAPCGG